MRLERCVAFLEMLKLVGVQDSWEKLVNHDESWLDAADLTLALIFRESEKADQTPSNGSGPGTSLGPGLGGGVTAPPPPRTPDPSRLGMKNWGAEGGPSNMVAMPSSKATRPARKYMVSSNSTQTQYRSGMEWIQLAWRPIHFRCIVPFVGPTRFVVVAGH